MNGRVLVIAPHADDELYGCGGTIMKLAAHGAQVLVAVMVAGDVTFEHSNERVHSTTRIAEFQAVCEAMHQTASGLAIRPGGMVRARALVPFSQDSQMDTVPIREVVAWIERLQDDHSASTWYVPGPSFHQDHRVCFEACMAAARPTRQNLPDTILKYELPTYSWNPREWSMRADLYEDITAYVEAKRELFKLYESQMRASGSPLAADDTIRWAQTRGREAQCEAAECFEVVRMIRR